MNVAAPVTDGRTTTNRPVGAVPAAGGSYARTSDTTNQALPVTSSVPVHPAGGSQPIDIRTPHLALRYIIALEGVSPSFQ